MNLYRFHYESGRRILFACSVAKARYWAATLLPAPIQRIELVRPLSPQLELVG